MRANPDVPFALALNLNNTPVARRTAFPVWRFMIRLLQVLLAVCLPVVAQGAQAAAGDQAQRPHANIAYVPQPRIVSAVDMRQTVEAKGSVHPLARPEFDRGAVPDEMPMGYMKLVFRHSADQEAALQQFLTDLQHPESENFHRWLTPEEYGEHFGPTDSDLAAVKGWLESQGLTVSKFARGKQTIEFTGTAGQVRSAFGTEIHYFEVNGEKHIANAQPMRIPAALAGVVEGVASMNDFHPVPAIHAGKDPAAQAGARAQNSGNGLAPMMQDAYGTGYFFDGLDLRAMYNVPSNLSGAGKRIGLPEDTDPMGGLINHGNGNYSVSDYDDYNTIQNLPTNLTVLVPYGDPGGGNVEPTLDMQVAHGIAPGAQIVMVICSDLDLAQDYMVDNDLADVVSLSYGTYISSASSFTDYTVARGEQAAAEGISYFAGSGDWGSGQSAGSVDNPYTDPTLGASLYASHPYVTSVGGTSADWGANGLYWWGDNNLLGIFANAEFQTTTVSGHIPEDSWNGSGGGYSPIYAQPSWQTGVPGIPTGNGRTFPDVSLDAGGPGYFTCVSGGCTDGNSASLNFAPQFWGGTSASSPAMAALIAILDQAHGRQGLINPTLYKLGASENWGACNGSSQSETRPPSSCVFYDTTTGSNADPGQANYGTSQETYNAGQGYDLVTGLGSVDLTAMINAWNNVSYIASTTTLSLGGITTAPYGNSVSFTGTVTANSGSGIPTGFVTIEDNNSHSYGVFALDGSGNFSGETTGFPIGTTSVKAVYGGDVAYDRSTSANEPLSITKIASSATVTFQPSETTSAYGARTFGFTIAVAGTTNYGNPTGNVVVNVKLASTGATNYIGSSPLTPNVGAPGSTTGSPQFIQLNTPPDTYTFIATYAGDATFSALASPATGAITITKAPTSLTVGSSTNSTTVGSPVTLNATLLSTQGQTAPTGTVQFYQNGRAVGSPVAVSGASLSNGAYTALASLITSALYPGSLPVTAVYSGDTNDSTSTSNAQTISITGATDTVSITSNFAGDDYLGSNLTQTATVFSQQSSPAITGSVQFFANGLSLGTSSVSSSTSGGKQIATATLQTTALPAGTDSVYAVYSGDANYDPETSYTITIPVIQTVPDGFTVESSLSFGNETLNVAATSQEVELGNSGTANLVFGSATITGANGSSFSILASTCSAGSQLTPLSGHYCNFNIGFTPQQTGALSASLVLTDNSPTSPHIIPLTGTGVPSGPYLQLSTPSMNFGVITANTTSAAQTVTLTNIGNTAITSLSFSGLTSTPFSVSATTCSDALASQASCTVSVTFAPTSAGLVSASLIVNQNSSAGPVETTVSLSGQGISADAASLLDVVHSLPGNFSSASSAVADAQGNIYVSDTPNNVVYKVDPTGNQTTLPISGLTSPGAMTMDANGYLYVISNGGFNNVNVIKFKSAMDQVAVPYTGISQATGVAVDKSGNIYVAVPSNSTVLQSAPGQSAATPIGFAKLGVVEVNAVAIDSNNNMYVTGSTGSSNVLNEIPGITGTYTTIASGLTNPVALAIGLSNSVYVADGTTNQVHAYLGGVPFLILDSPAITGVSNIFVDANANLYLASAGQIFESSNLPRANAGFATIGTPGSAWVTMNVPAGNSITTISATDLAGDNEWTLPTGNTCTVSNGVCSFQVKFSPVYPGMRAGTVRVTDGVGSTHAIDFYGVGQGPQATFLTGNKSTIVGTWVPSALTTDTVGNVYVLDQTNSSAPIIQKITPAGTVSLALDPTSADGGPNSSLAVDGQGNFYLTAVNQGPGIFEYQSGNLNEVSPGSGTVSPFALDGAGNYYQAGGNQVVVSDSRFNTLATYTYGTSSSVTVNNLTVDSLKNIYVTTSEPAVYITSWAGVNTKLLDSSTSPGGFTLSNPTGITVDAAGTLYVADAGANALFRIDAQDNASAFGLNLTNPSVIGVTITPQGTLYLADQANNAVYRFDPSNATFAFGNVNDETSSSVQSVLLTNTGNLPLAINSLASPASYTQEQDSAWCTTSTSLTNGGVCDLTFLIDPSSLGSVGGSVTVTDNSLNSTATQHIALTGQSVVGPPSQVVFSTPPPASIDALSNFGQVAIQLKDLAGNVVTSSTDTVSLTVKDGAGNVFYTASSAAVAGAVSFNLSTLQVTNSGTYTFIATDVTTTSATATPTATSTVNKLSQTVTFGALANQTYGVAPITLNATASSGLTIGYTVTGQATLSGNTLQVIGIGSITITAQQTGNSTYSAATSVVRSFTVTPALLTVTPNNTNKYINQVNPTLTYTITGYVNGDAVEFPVVFGAASLTTTATASSPVGTYPIMASLGTLTTANYTFQFGTGTLTVIQPSSPVAPPISWVNPAPITYGTPLSATQLNAATVTAGTFTYSPAASAILAGGNQTLTVTFNPTDTIDYTTSSATVQLTVNQASPTATLTSSANPGIAGSPVIFTATVNGVAGGAVPTGEVAFTLSGYSETGKSLGNAVLNNGVATLTTSSLAPGQQPYSIQAIYQSDANYASVQTGNLPQLIDPEVNVGSSTTFQMNVISGAGTGTVANIAVGAAGAPGQEFSLLPGGSCAVGGALGSYSFCTANIKFTPARSGIRYGAITLTDASGNIITTNQLAAIGLGSQVSFLPGTQSTIGSGFLNPGGVAVDALGNMYVADSSHGQVILEPAGGGAPVVVDNNLSFPSGIAVDGAGNVYIADSGNNRVVMDTLTSSGYVQNTVPTSALNTPGSVAVDYNGDLFIADTFNSRILEETNSQFVSSSAWTESVIPTSTLSNPGGVAVDAAGDIYIADTYNSRILQESPTAGGYNETTLPVTASLVNPLAVAVDGNGNVYFTSFIGSGVQKMTPSAGSYIETTLPYASGIFPAALTVDGIGNLYIADSNSNSVFKEDFADAPSVSFATATNVDSSDSTDGAETVQLMNIGNEPLIINKVNYPADFPLAPGDSSACATGSVAVGQQCDLPIQFAPVHAGSLDEKLTVIDNALNAANSTQSITITGEGIGTPAVLTSPAAGISTVLGASDVTFQWTAGAGVTLYQLNLSAIAPGQSELFLYKGTSTSAIAPTLPANGVTIYATLYSKIDGVWQSNAYEYTESGTPTPATLTSPTPGPSTKLGTTNVGFEWNAGAGVTLYQLNLSAVAPGQSELFVYKGTATSAIAPALPANGVIIYATLYSKINGVWQSNAYEYTESGTLAPAALTSPTPGITTILGTTNLLFQWTAGTSASDYQLNLSAIAPGGSELYLYKGTALSATAPTLPANGVKIYARLYSKIDGVWLYNDYVYTEH